MSAYRILTLDELEILKTEFIQFLAVQGISGSDWSKWQSTNQEKRDQLIQQFSEFVFVQVLDKVHIFERTTEQGLQYILFSTQIMSFISIQHEGDIKDWSAVDLQECQVVKGKKAITKDIQEEKFALLTQGFFPVAKENVDSVLALFETISKL